MSIITAAEAHTIYQDAIERDLIQDMEPIFAAIKEAAENKNRFIDYNINVDDFYFIVDYLNKLGYTVKSISSEFTNEFTGERMILVEISF